jgi:hypothetical protein
LGANDDDFSDNQGSMTVRITIQPVTSFQPRPLGMAGNIVTSVNNVNSLDPALNLVGVSIEYRL